MNNYFDYPQYYRNQLLKYKYFDSDIVSRYNGKSLMYAFLTRYCCVGCEFCFNRSQSPSEKKNINDQFSDFGIEKLIKFCEKANLGCLIISGGGDPFLQKEQLLRLIEFAQADRIVLVTSGFWSRDYESTKKIIDEIYESFKRRKKKAQLVLRISISCYHAKVLGVEPALNVIKVFDEHYYGKDDNFNILLKTFDDDEAFELFLKKLDYDKLSDCEENVSDNFIVEKILRKKRTLTLKSGLEIIVGISKIFHTSVLPDLSNKDNLSQVVQTVDDDIFYSLRQFPATILNTDGSIGLNWSIYYNGNTCLWQSQARDTYQNIYEDDYDHVIASHFNDPLIYSFIDKGSVYRDSIVSEVSPLSVFRSKATGLRDRLGLYLIEDERVRLYHMVRSIQDYIKEGVLSSNCLLKNEELYQLVNQSVTDLIKLFKNSTFDSLAQELSKPFNEITFYDFLALIKLKHFDLDQSRVQEAVEWYNKNTKNKKIESIDDVQLQENPDTYRRIGNRQMSIKDSIIGYKHL